MRFFTSLVLAYVLFAPFSLFAQEPIRIVCVGNSITEGYGNTSAANAWPAQFNRLLGSNYTVYNCGVSGTMMLRNGSSPYWNTNRFTDAKNYDPDILIISLGTNDAGSGNWSRKDEFYGDYMAMVAEFRKNGRKPIIYLCFPAPVFGNAAQDATITKEVIPLIEKVRTDVGAYSIDFHNNLQNNKADFPDGIHPDDAGSAVMANVVYQVVKGKQLIVPSIVQDGVATASQTASLAAGSSLTLSPQAGDGSWSWTGPNGLTATSRELSISNFQENQAGTYTVVYTNTAGERSLLKFTVSLLGCAATAIIPYLQANSDPWQSATAVTLAPGGTLCFGPQAGDGVWKWTGPNGFFTNERQFIISGIRKDQAGVYTANYYNAAGCKSTKEFTISVVGEVVCPTLTSYINYASAWVKGTEAPLATGGGVTFGPQPSDGTWNWRGPNGFTKNSREASVNGVSKAQAGQYIGVFTNPLGCKDSITVNVTVDGSSGLETAAPIIQAESGLTIYPNPVSNILKVKSENSKITLIELLDLKGTVCKRHRPNADQDTMDLSALRPGQYVLKIDLTNHPTVVTKIIKKN